MPQKVSSITSLFTGSFRRVVFLSSPVMNFFHTLALKMEKITNLDDRKCEFLKASLAFLLLTMNKSARFLA